MSRSRKLNVLGVLSDGNANLVFFGFNVVPVHCNPIWIVDAHGYAKRFIVRADEKLTAFAELHAAIHAYRESI